MSRTALLVIACLFAQIAVGQAAQDQKAAYRARWERLYAIEKRIRETRPQRRDNPLRAENISDDEVREIQAVASQLLPNAILNISGVVNGCPCEEGPSCSDQVWILANRSDKTIGLQMSKISNHWAVGAIQRWWLEYEAFEARGNSFRPIMAYFDARNALEERFPSCASQSAKSDDAGAPRP